MKDLALYLRTIIFGVTDSLVSTVGLLAGLHVAGKSHSLIILTGIIYAFVESFSMAVGNFLSEESAEEFTAQSSVSGRLPLLAGVVMFIAFILAAFIPIAPYLIFDDWTALAGSVGFSILALFILGIVSARISRLPMLWRGVRMALLGGAAIIMGVLVGTFVPES